MFPSGLEASIHSIRRPIHFIVFSVGLLLACLALFPAPPSPAPHPLYGSAYRNRGLHLILPGIATGEDSCRALLSAAISGYPDPVFVGWSGHGLYNGSTSELFQISETLAYLRTLQKSADDDLAIIADPRGTAFQLPPEIVVSRYSKAIEKGNSRLQARRLLRKRGADRINIESRILITAGNTCGPIDESKDLPSCHADGVERRIQGPLHNHAELYLSNSVMMGSVKDLRAMLITVMDRIDEEFNNKFQHRHSAQHYLTMVWDDQESAREQVHNSTRDAHAATGYMMPERAEFGLTLDRDGDVFLHTATHGRHIRWASLAGSKEADTEEAKWIQSFGAQEHDQKAQSEGDEEWKSLIFGTYIASHNAFPMYFAVDETGVRESWWSNLWFHPKAEMLLENARRRRVSLLKSSHDAGQPVSIASVGRIRYSAVSVERADDFQHMRSRDGANLRGGAWNDQGEYMSWQEICRPYEDDLFLREEDL